MGGLEEGERLEEIEVRGEGGEDRKQTRRDAWSDQRTSGRGRFELNLDPGGGDRGGFGYGVLLGGFGIGWKVERVVGVFDEVEGGKARSERRVVRSERGSGRAGGLGVHGERGGRLRRRRWLPLGPGWGRRDYIGAR